MPKRLLIADDDALFARLLQNELTQRPDWQIAVAESCDATLAALEEEPPHLLLLDLRFPQGNGFAVLEHIRAKNYDFPVVVVTNYPKSMHAQRCTDLGVRDYLVKSEWKIDRLVAQLEAFMA